jgi:hypothetical protein
MYITAVEYPKGRNITKSINPARIIVEQYWVKVLSLMLLLAVGIISGRTEANPSLL